MTIPSLVQNLIFFSLLLTLKNLAPIHGQCLNDQRTLLVELKSELIFDSNHSLKLVRWNNETAGEDCCKWNGVKCDGGGRVISLQLDGESISGGLTVSSSLFRLRYLQNLNLANNALNGSLSDLLHFEGLSKLTQLNLRQNSLSGTISYNVFALPSLQQLDLSRNKFSGQINDDQFPVVNFSNLFSIDLSLNSLSGAVPLSFFGMPSLLQLDLSYNRFSGHVKEFSSNISALGFLLLNNNLLEGPIPHFFSLLQSLQLLDLSYNNFNGTFQLEKFQGLPNLENLYLSYNNLSIDATNINSSLHGFPNLYGLGLASCNLSDFPDFIKQSYLTNLDLSNNRIAGDIPSWIWEIGNGTLLQLNLSGNMLEDLQKPYLIPTSLSTLDLHSNQLHGELPLLPQGAQYVDYSSNYFHKPIPPTFFANISSNIYFLSLANNSLTGAIPTPLCNATMLEVLDLSFNNLTSTIPPCIVESMNSLRVLNLRGNNINGVIPAQFSLNCSLRTLDLRNNNLGGKISNSTLANCKSLAVLNVGYNKFDDTFPCMLPQSLHVLVLRSNKFHGELRCDKSWPNLQIVDLSSNNFNGSLHLLNFSTWRGMMLQNDEHLKPNRSRSNLLGQWYSYYQDEVIITVKGVEVNLVKIWPEFTSIDMSCNNFEGGIPDEVGDLRSLYLLNLSHNALTATIPKSLGALRELGSLDLSANQLRGRIPEELTGLTFLSILNLSYNELVGMIPKGPQFNAFLADWFEGNTGLCGFPLNRSCSSVDGNGSTPPEEEKGEDDDEEVEWKYVCAAVGYVVGLGSIAWILLFCRRFRERYFGKIEEVVEKIFDRRERRKRAGRRRRVMRRNAVRN